MDAGDRRPGASVLRDCGKEALVVNVEYAAEINSDFRFALWTGKYLQLTLMSIPAGESVGGEIHPDTDQLLCVESGRGTVLIGAAADAVTLRRRVGEGDAILIPAGTWHNVVNVGRSPLKLYSVYAPPHHPFGTVQPTKEDAEQAY